MPRAAWRRRLLFAALASPFALGPLAACSSFSAATVDADSGAPDGASPDTSMRDAMISGEASELDAAPQMSVMVFTFDGPGSCTLAWNPVGGATMTWIQMGDTDAGGACEVCATCGSTAGGNATPFVELALPARLGSYTINAFVRTPQEQTASTAGMPGVGFQVTSTAHDGSSQDGNGVYDETMLDDTWQGAGKTTTLTTLTASDGSAIIIRAVLEVDNLPASEAGCFDVDAIDVIFSPSGP